MYRVWHYVQALLQATSNTSANHPLLPVNLLCFFR